MPRTAAQARVFNILSASIDPDYAPELALSTIKTLHKHAHGSDNGVSEALGALCASGELYSHARAPLQDDVYLNAATAALPERHYGIKLVGPPAAVEQAEQPYDSPHTACWSI